VLPGSFTVARPFGIPLRVHWTFAVLLLWILVSGARQGGTLASGVVSVVFMLGVFLCVVLHELGHALVARRYGSRTRDITLLPIGGVASLEKIPEKPAQELAVAVAGPLVNVVIAGGLFLLTGLAWQEGIAALLAADRPGFHLGHLLASLAAVNVWLVLFNLIPAFPMDGGRVLRAILASVVGRLRATRLAARIGQGLAAAMAVAGLFLSPMLILIAIFVWIAGAGELQQTANQSALRGLPVGAAMQRRFQVLGVEDTLQVAADELLASAQQDFPVTTGGRLDEPIVGVLTRTDLLAAFARGAHGARVREIMRPGCAAVDEADPLDAAVEAMRISRCPLVPVSSQGRLVGLLTLENVAELVMMRSATDTLGA
jgi:Zn-dependent protease